MLAIGDAYRAFQQEVQARLGKPDAEPEEQLRVPLEQFLQAVGQTLGMPLRCIGETRLPHALGKPDFAVYRNDLLVGYIELKAPGVGADARRFKGRNREQYERFKAIPNLLYTDGEEWGLYRSGELARIVQIRHTDTPVQATLEPLLRDFLSWQPIIPFTRTGAVDMRRFAEQLAPLCRLLRAEILESLQQPDSPIRTLAADWRALLFPDADDAQFADAYAQTLAFALLLGRLEGADPLTSENATQSLRAQHGLLARALQLLTDPQARPDIDAALNLLLRLLGALPIQPAQPDDDPWLYFYEDFLAVYDPDLRRDAGAYYTPLPVVQAQVRLVDELLRTRLHKKLGFADPEVLTLDPAMGAGTYLLSIVNHALQQVAHHQGAGAVAPAASQLARNLHGFELMVGP
ncbi:MAG: DNA methyltransferase, partial [Fimbriimonadales bacterium]